GGKFALRSGRRLDAELAQLLPKPRDLLVRLVGTLAFIFSALAFLLRVLRPCGNVLAVTIAPTQPDALVVLIGAFPKLQPQTDVLQPVRRMHLVLAPMQFIEPEDAATQQVV